MKNGIAPESAYKCKIAGSQCSIFHLTPIGDSSANKKKRVWTDSWMPHDGIVCVWFFHGFCVPWIKTVTIHLLLLWTKWLAGSREWEQNGKVQMEQNHRVSQCILYIYIYIAGVYKWASAHMYWFPTCTRCVCVFCNEASFMCRVCVCMCVWLGEKWAF